ncbi:MAG: SIS domain-containing protein, partial [Candidatus Omnitrophica bacterium]|nr:SIS domain-containing protein [Candidatus Omnitrophota bacterium]
SSKSEEGKDAGKEEKRVKYKKKLEEQLNPNISEEELKNRKNWPFIDSRTNIPKDKLTQITLKPIYPAEKHIASKEDSAREILGNLIIEPVVKKINSLLLELQPELVSIEVTLGGSTSIDFARKDVSKGTAAEDLIKEAKLEKERDLALAIGDEMGFTGVDFAFLKNPKITVISVEDPKNNKKREYTKFDEDKIEANWFWSGDYPELGGVGISATLGIYLMLEELYAEEVFRLFEGEKDIVPAIRRLRQKLEGLPGVDQEAQGVTDGGRRKRESIVEVDSQWSIVEKETRFDGGYNNKKRNREVTVKPYEAMDILSKHVSKIVLPGLDFKQTFEFYSMLLKAIKEGRNLYYLAAGRSGQSAAIFEIILNSGIYQMWDSLYKNDNTKRKVIYRIDTESSYPPVTDKDLVIVISGSGGTPSINRYANDVFSIGPTIIAITAKTDAQVWQDIKAKIIIKIPGNVKTTEFDSLQNKEEELKFNRAAPMGTSFEFAVGMYLLSIVESFTKGVKSVERLESVIQSYISNTLDLVAETKESVSEQDILDAVTLIKTVR